MNSHPVHAISSQILRRWTIDSREFGRGSRRPAPVPPYSERVDGEFQLLASRLALVKSALARQTG